MRKALFSTTKVENHIKQNNSNLESRDKMGIMRSQHWLTCMELIHKIMQVYRYGDVATNYDK